MFKINPKYLPFVDTIAMILLSCALLVPLYALLVLVMIMGESP